VNTGGGSINYKQGSATQCDNGKKVNVKQSPYRPGVTQRVPGS